MKVKLNKPALGLDGSNIVVNNKPIMLGYILAEQLANSLSKDEKIIDQLCEWGAVLIKNEEIDVSLEELILLKTMVLESPSLTVLVKKQILKSLAEAK